MFFYKQFRSPHSFNSCSGEMEVTPLEIRGPVAISFEHNGDPRGGRGHIIRTSGLLLNSTRLNTAHRLPATLFF